MYIIEFIYDRILTLYEMENVNILFIIILIFMFLLLFFIVLIYIRIYQVYYKYFLLYYIIYKTSNNLLRIEASL